MLASDMLGRRDRDLCEVCEDRPMQWQAVTTSCLCQMMTSDAINYFGNQYLKKKFHLCMHKMDDLACKSPKQCLHSSLPLECAPGHKHLSC